MKPIRLTRISLALLALGCSGKLNVGNGGAGGNIGTGGNTGTGGNIGYGGMSQDGGRWQGFTGGSGGQPSRGGLGDPCIEGEVVVEAAGTVAETEVKTLSRCATGYFCSPEGRCEPLSPCEASVGGDCVVFGSPPTGSGGSGGVSGTGGSATGGSPVNDPPIAEEHTGITGVTADPSRVYWVAYGTRDRLGNYNHDGSLRAFSLADGTVTTLARDLAGPTGVGVTSAYAYVMVDGGALIGTEERAQVFRVPLSGGEKTLVQSSGVASNHFRAFVAAGTRAFWPANRGGEIDSIEDEEAMASAFLPNASLKDTGWPTAADQTHLYYTSWDQYPGVRRVSVADGSVDDLARPSRGLVVRGETMYGIEALDDGSGLILGRAPTAGGDWVRTRALGGSGTFLPRLQLAGDRLFFARVPTSFPASATTSVMMASLASDAPLVRILERNIGYTDSVWWVGTADALFWTDGNALYRRALE